MKFWCFLANNQKILKYNRVLWHHILFGTERVQLGMWQHIVWHIFEDKHQNILRPRCPVDDCLLFSCGDGVVYPTRVAQSPVSSYNTMENTENTSATTPQGPQAQPRYTPSLIIISFLSIKMYYQLCIRSNNYESME